MQEILNHEQCQCVDILVEKNEQKTPIQQK